MPVKKKEEPPAAAPKKEEAKPAAAAPAAEAAPAPAAKAKPEKKREKRHKEEKGVTQCTRLKETKLLGHVQLASGVDQDTLWQITMTGTLAVTAALRAISRNKQF